MRWYLEEYKAKRTDYVVMWSIQAVTVAKALGTLTDADIDSLRRLVKRLRKHVAKSGKEPKRLDRLVQFESRQNVQKMLALSEYVVRNVRGRPRSGRSVALQIQMALVHEVFLVTSLRRKNVAQLNLEQNIIWPDGPAGDRCLIRIPGRQVKNGESVHKELPDYVIDLLRHYLTNYRPLLIDKDSPWLIPGKKGSHKKPPTLTQQYRTFIHEWTGLDVTPHLLRSFADMIYTEKHPEGAEVMRRQLAHRSPETRLKHYCDPKSRAAGREYQRLLLEERTEALAQLKLFKKHKAARRGNRP